MTQPGSPESCNGCSIGRRAFLRDAAVAATALAAVGSKASALPVRFVEALRARGKEVTYAIPAADGVSIDKSNDIILVRSGKGVYAFDLSCPHQNTALRWKAADKRFECPKHHSLYSPEGVYIEGRATRSMDRHEIRRDGTNVIVDLDKIYEEDHDGDLWKGAHVEV